MLKSLPYLLLVLVCTGLFSVDAAAAAKSCVTAECHAMFASGEKVHPGDLSCEGCHVPTGSPHPGASGAFAMAPTVCLSCHDNLSGRASTHAPVREGNCGACHRQHAGKAKLLGREREDLCLQCHQNVAPAGAAFLHGPVAERDCLACHLPHDSANGALLVKPYTRKNLVDYRDDSFTLCFSCHDQEMLHFADTSFGTAFRDGERNLHYLHVNRTVRGKACKLCHAVHSAERPKLIADKVGYGQWRMPIGFEKTASGGSCAPGCHRPLEYDRERPAAKPEPRQKQGKAAGSPQQPVSTPDSDKGNK